MTRIDIKSEREFFREIYEKIRSGKYAIPVFQRDFVWKESQIIDFFDSIWRGYPIGSIILWQPDSEMPIKNILTDEISNVIQPEYFVLDGRQRLTAFFGCVNDTGVNKSRFSLYFNLDTESFTFNCNDRHVLIKVSEVYDTFAMLDKMHTFTSNPAISLEKAKLYVDRAKKLNAILQGYVVGEIYINNCSLKEAEKVFSRINSEGTKISKSDMLQAITYKRDGVLLSEEIKKIQLALEPYGFRNISHEDILNCFYKFIDKNFYDARSEDLEVMNFAKVIPEIKEVIVASVKFLHDECNVLSLNILPYTKQLIAVTWFFKRYKTPTENQIWELKRWFLYTTYTTMFQNGSLTNVRKVFRRFEDFLDGKSDSAIDYHSVMRYSFDYKFSLRNATSDFLILVLINNYKKYTSVSQNIEYCGIYASIYQKKPEFQFVLLNKCDKAWLTYNLSENGVDMSADELCKYVLDSTTLNAFRERDDVGVLFERRGLLLKCISDILDEYDIPKTWVVNG